MRKVSELISGDFTSAEECSQEKEKELLERCNCWLMILSNLLSDRLFLIIQCLVTVCSRLPTTSSLQFSSQRTETLFTGREALLESTEIKEKSR